MRPPEEVKREFARQWIDKANADFLVASHLISGDPALFAAACFHAQQAAEKYLKAFLVVCQIEFPKTHDIEIILDLVAKADRQLADSLRPTAVLSPFGAEIRYPGNMPEPSLEETKNAVSLAAKVRDSIFGVLKGIFDDR